MLKALLIKLYNFMIQRKNGEISLPGLKRHTGELFLFILSYDKPCGKLALGQNFIKIISSDKTNSVVMFLRIQTDIEILKCHVRATFSLKCRSK